MPDYVDVEYASFTHSFFGFPDFGDGKVLSGFDAVILGFWQSAQDEANHVCNGLAHSVRLASQRYSTYLPEEDLNIFHRIKAADAGDIDIAPQSTPSSILRLREIGRSGAAPIVIDCSEAGGEKLLIEAFSEPYSGLHILNLPGVTEVTRRAFGFADNAILAADAGRLIGQYHLDGIPRFEGLSAGEFLSTLRFLAASGGCGLCLTGFQESDTVAHLLTQAMIYWLAGMAMRRQEI